jgi:hypothetical protein
MLTYPFSEERIIGVWLFQMHPLRALRKKKSVVEEERAG